MEDNRRGFSLRSPFLEWFCIPSDPAWATSVRFSVLSQQRQCLKMLTGEEPHSLVVRLIKASSNILAQRKASWVLSSVWSPSQRTAQLVNCAASDSPFSKCLHNMFVCLSVPEPRYQARQLPAR